jgi:transposase
VDALRAHLAEFGMMAAQGLRNVSQLIAVVREDGDTRLPDVARQVLQVLANQIESPQWGHLKVSAVWQIYPRLGPGF